MRHMNSDATKRPHEERAHHQRGFGNRVQHALGRLAPRSWGIHTHSQHAATDADSSSRASAAKHRQHQRVSGGLELSSRQSTSSIGTEPGAVSDSGGPDALGSGTAADVSRPQTASISHISSTGSLGAATNDANSVASGSSQPTRQYSTPPAATVQHTSSTPGDDLCSLATQAGSAAHSFTSLQSMMTNTHGDASSDGGTSLIPAAPAPATASERAAFAALSASPTAGASSSISLLSAYRSSDAGGDATSVSTLPLISEAGIDERLLETHSSLCEQQESEHTRREGSSEGGAEPNSDAMQQRPRISSHGSYTSLTSNTSDHPSGSGLAAAAARLPSPAHTRAAHGQRSSSRHSFQQQLQQQLLQDLEESQEEGSSSTATGLPMPFSTRKRPENDDMCSYATQAGSSVHSLSSVLSHMDNMPSQRQQWSSDGTPLQASGSTRSFSSLQPQSRSRRSSAETAGPTAAVSPAHFDYTPTAMSPGTGSASGLSSPRLSTLSQDQQACEPHMLHRKNSLKGALKAVSRWGSGIGQRLQRAGSGGPHAQQQQQHGRKHAPQQQEGLQQQEGRRNSRQAAAKGDCGQEMVSLSREQQG